MAKFTKGQRVRIVRSRGFHPGAVGLEAVIEGVKDADSYWLDVPEYNVPAILGYWAFGDQLEPLIDPRADAFIERIKKLKPLDAPVAPKVTA